MADFDFSIRSEALLGVDSMRRLSKAKIGIAGLGGVGGAIAPVLARLGIGHITAGDPGYYDLPDLNRQAGAFRSTLGNNKAAVYATMLKDINPNMSTEIFTEGVTHENIPSFVDDMDIIVDALDVTVPPALRIALYNRVKQQSKYVILPPIVGFGNVVAISPPGGYPMDSVLGLLAKATTMGVFPKGLHKIFDSRIIETMEMSIQKKLIPSLSLATTLSASIVATEIMMILCRETLPGWREPVLLPNLIVTDLLRLKIEVVKIQDLLEEPSTLDRMEG